MNHQVFRSEFMHIMRLSNTDNQPPVTKSVGAILRDKNGRYSDERTTI